MHWRASTGNSTRDDETRNREEQRDLRLPRVVMEGQATQAGCQVRLPEGSQGGDTNYLSLLPLQSRRGGGACVLRDQSEDRLVVIRIRRIQVTARSSRIFLPAQGHRALLAATHCLFGVLYL
ncbi:unnamed protein product [Sphagnum balticum]